MHLTAISLITRSSSSTSVLKLKLRLRTRVSFPREVAQHVRRACLVSRLLRCIIVCSTLCSYLTTLVQHFPRTHSVTLSQSLPPPLSDAQPSQSCATTISGRASIKQSGSNFPQTFCVSCARCCCCFCCCCCRRVTATFFAQMGRRAIKQKMTRF